MPKEEWGTNRVCPTTGKRFYDLNRDPVVSPYTGDVVNIDGSKSGRTMVADKPDRDAKTQEMEDDTQDVVLEDDNQEDVSLDDDEDVLEDDDDNVSLDELADVGEDDTDES